LPQDVEHGDPGATSNAPASGAEKAASASRGRLRIHRMSASFPLAWNRTWCDIDAVVGSGARHTRCCRGLVDDMLCVYISGPRTWNLTGRLSLGGVLLSVMVGGSSSSPRVKLKLRGTYHHAGILDDMTMAS
jgi:hypothetical protein